MTYPLFGFGGLDVLLFSHLLLLQKSGELDKVVLDQNILLSQLSLLELELFLFHLEFLLLVIERLLNLVHQPSLFQKPGGWGH